jgi:hypothetical protein
MWNEAHAAPGSDTSMPVWRQQQGQMFATLSSPQQAIPMQQQVHAQPAASNGFWAQFGLGPAAPAWQALAQLRSRVLGDNGFQGPVSASNHAEQAPAPMVRDAWSMLELRRRRGERDRTADLMGILDSLAPSPAGQGVFRRSLQSLVSGEGVACLRHGECQAYSTLRTG